MLLVMVDFNDLGGLLSEASVFDAVATSANAPEDDGGNDEDGHNTGSDSNVKQDSVHEGAAVASRAVFDDTQA